MNIQKPLAMIVLCAVVGAGCATTDGPNEEAGMVIGGVLGGILGQEIGHGTGQTAATIIGTLMGASIGGSIGRSMEDTDRLKVAHSLETVRTGVPSTWRNPDTGSRYTVTSTRTYEGEGAPCREFTMDAAIGGSDEKVYGTACRQADGSWKIIN